MPDLFGDEEDNCEEELKINKGYANHYNDWRQKEELNKLKTKYGEHLSELNSDEEESTSSSEDEDANCLTEECEKDFYETLVHLQKNDPKIYDDKVDFFADVRKNDEIEEDNVGSSSKKIKKEKKQPLYLRDYERKIITERNGKFSDSEDEDMQKNSKNNDVIKVPYVEEQRQILESIKKGAEVIDDDDEIFKCKPKTDKQIEEQNEEELLENEKQSGKLDKKKDKVLKVAAEVWADPKLPSEEKFLRDYILNNKFLDNDNVIENIEDPETNELFSEDEKYIEENQEFEHKYNYRFEEPDQEFIKRYPRTMENSLRKKDTRRATKRVEVKKRKEEEKIRQKEELKQLKALKRKEIMDKIAQLKEITGNDDMKLDSIDLDGDFDPAEHDKKMQELFNEEYYNNDENIKPEFPEMDEELGIESTWDNYDPNVEEIEAPNDHNSAPHCEDDEFIMDADYDPHKSLQDELVGTSKKKRRRRSKFSEVIAKEKPKFDPNVHPSFKNYIDQYYALDYEDMIGDLPCRFKYRSVVPNDYGLSIDEILMADDKELNKWCSLKKALEHKPEQVELNEVRIYKQKAANEEFKKKVLQSLYKPQNETNNEEDNSITAVTQTNDEQSSVVEDGSKKKRKRKKKKSNVTNSQEAVAETSSTDKIPEQSVSESSTKQVNKKEKNLKRPAETIEQTQNHNDSVKTPEMKIKRQKTDKSTDGKSHKTKNINGENEKIISKKLQRKAKFQQRQKNNKIQTTDNPIASLSDERLKAYNLNPRKFKNKLKYGKKN
ncbi:hypothetical protein PV328_005159 [Microctonus aethiopoides]|uniref:Protein KRI1 homolog n=1 Tax=Microctonus aethiopoides TaxID=144406 RepID=A0AA39FLD3_9HYME|nr:hypothetical protein PV328_005159 [Microctonus aethiopoides]